MREMNTEIVVTPIEIWQSILLICGGIITIGGAIAVVKRWICRIKRPSAEIKTEVDNVAAMLEQHAQYFKNDKIAIAELKRGQNIMYKSHLALISHAIDGNNTEQLKEVKKDLQEFLLQRN